MFERHSYECYLTDRVEEAIASRHRALECWRDVGDRRREGDNLRWLSRLAWFQGDGVEAHRTGHSAVEMLLESPPGPELAMAYSNLAQLSMLADNVDATLHWGGLAIESAQRFGRMDILAHALNNVGAATALVDPPTGRATLARSLTLAREHNLEEHVAHAYTISPRWEPPTGTIG